MVNLVLKLGDIGVKLIQHMKVMGLILTILYTKYLFDVIYEYNI